MPTRVLSPSAHPGLADGRRVLLVAPDLDLVGTGRQVALLAAGLVHAGYDTHVASLTTRGRRLEPPLTTHALAAGVTTHALGGRPVPDVAATARLARLAVRLRPGIVISHGRRLVPHALAARGAARGLRVVARVGVAVQRERTALCLRACDLVVASSPAVAATCRGATVAIIPPGVAPGAGTSLDRGSIARRLGLDPARVWTLCVAPLESEARLERLIWAIDQLGVVHRGLEHVLVGSGPLLRRVRRRAYVQELADRLLVMPSCPILPDLLSHVRLTWQSGEVACGGAVLDGMACGVPAVMVESDAARQLVVDGETGRIVPAQPESELPRRALSIIEDDALAGRYGAAAAARAATEFPAERMVARWVDVLRRFLP